MAGRNAFLVTCEHGGNRLPARYAAAFATREAHAWLRSHRGYDPGSLAATKQIASRLQVRPIKNETTRLLIDLNRSLDNPQLFSKFARRLTDRQRESVVRQVYDPYRRRVTEAIESALASGTRRLVHLSIHTFTATYHGRWRPIDIGLLFDPDRPSEQRFCEAWQHRAAAVNTRPRVVFNQPYAGTDDGLTTTLRKRFGDAEYLGIEIEISNRFAKRSAPAQAAVVEHLMRCLPDE